MTALQPRENPRLGLYAKAWLEALHRGNPGLEQQLEKAGDLHALALSSQEVAEAEEEAIVSQLLESDPLPTGSLARAAKYASHLRKARDVAMNHLLEPFAELPPASPEATTA